MGHMHHRIVSIALIAFTSLLVTPVTSSGTYPSDPPALAPFAPLSLDGTWSLSCPTLNRAVHAQVPGDIITDLQVCWPLLTFTQTITSFPSHNLLVIRSVPALFLSLCSI